MNPRTNYEEHSSETVRAFVYLHKYCQDDFQYSVDGYDDEEEVRGYLFRENDQSIIGITAINEQDKFNNIVEKCQEMGLETTVEVTEEYHDSLGEYTAYQLEAKPTEVSDKYWNRPMMIVYGSLNPEIKEILQGRFNEESYFGVRNHYIITGQEVNSETKTTLSDDISQSPNIFDDYKRDYTSSMRTADLV